MNESAYRRVTDTATFGRVAVLLGGTSAEREISLMTGQAVHAALVARGVDAHAVDATGDYIDALTDGGFDRVWVALHGRGGEDGVVQGLLESLGMPYTGSGVLGSALGMDKMRTKRLFGGLGIGTPAWSQIESAEECPSVAAQLGCPLIVKPALEGSSIGMTKVEQAEDLEDAWREAARLGSEVFAEAWVSGPEYTATILHDEVLPLIQIAANNIFYDYQAKYFSDETRYICPCDLAPEKEREYGELALKAFRTVGASGWGRVDFMLDEESGVPQFLEVNTIPGMTSHSLVPMAAKQADIDFGELVWRILETSFVVRGLESAGDKQPAISLAADQENDDAA